MTSLPLPSGGHLSLMPRIWAAIDFALAEGGTQGRPCSLGLGRPGSLGSRLCHPLSVMSKAVSLEGPRAHVERPGSSGSSAGPSHRAPTSRMQAPGEPPANCRTAEITLVVSPLTLEGPVTRQEVTDGSGAGRVLFHLPASFKALPSCPLPQVSPLAGNLRSLLWTPTAHHPFFSCDTYAMLPIG